MAPLGKKKKNMKKMFSKDFSFFFSPRNKKLHLSLKLRKLNLRNLGGLAATGLTNNDGSGVSLNQI